MSQTPAPHYTAPSTATQAWRIEQFEFINRITVLGLIGATLAFGATYFIFLPTWTMAAATLLTLLLLGVVFATERLSPHSQPEVGISIFAYSIIIYLVLIFYVQRDLLPINIVAMLIPMALGSYLLDPIPARRIAIVSGIGIGHNVILSILNLFPPPSLPTLAIVVLNVVTLPVGVAILILLNFRASHRAAQAINRLQEQSAALEEAVNRRTAQLTAASDVSRAVAGSLNLDELLSQAVNLIRDRFGYYHAAVFLLDDSGQNAVVREATGEVGKLLKERQHTLAVGSQSIIGYVTAQRKARIAQEVVQDAAHLKNPLLPDTQSEVGIPLLVGDQVLGALDVQSTQPNAFTATDVNVLQTLADQIAIAINNAQVFTRQQKLLEENQHLLQESQSSVEELNAIAGRLSQEGWLNFIESGRSEFLASSQNGEAVPSSVPELALGQALQKRDIVSVAEEDRSALAAPIVLRDQIIGALAIEDNDPSHRWSADDLALAHEVADRLGLALDNARLLEQVNRERERLTFLFEASRSLSSSLEFNQTFNTTLGFAPRIGAEHGFILLTRAFGTQQYPFRSTIPGLNNLRDDRARAVNEELSAEGLVHWVLENEQSVVVRDTTQDPRWKHGPEFIRSVLMAPLRSTTGAVAGVLAYTHPQANAFNDEQLPFIESISVQVSAALNNALLYSRIRTQQFGAQSVANATQIMARSLSDTELMQTVTEQLFSIFKPNGVVVYRWNSDSETLTPVARQVAESESEAEWPPLDQPLPESQRPDLADVAQERASRILKLRDEADGQIREAMLVPFVFNDQVEGVVEVVHTGPAYGLSQDDLGLFQSILTSAAFALQTARLYQQLSETAERLREVDRLKSQFLANMSHELRTPLNSIIGFSRVIMKGIDGPINETQLQDLTAINNSGQHLLGLINDILDLSRIEAGKMELNFDHVDLHEIIKGVMSTTVGLVKDKPIHLIPQVPADLPLVHADAIRVRQVLLNLMSNAAKFTDEGTITVKASVIYNERQWPMVQVSVIDTGPGITEDGMAHLFQTFSQVDGSATRKVGGSGLGLSICKNLIELHGGKIWAESTVGVGSTFSFTVPAIVEQSEITALTPEAPESQYKIQAVLAIDDDARLIDLYRRYLEPKGFTLHGLVNPREAVAAARALKPQIILLDVVMPDYDGWHVMQDLKNNAETRDIPVIVCSILTEQEKARNLGATDYLVKPILDIDLVTALDNIHSHRNSNGNGNGHAKQPVAPNPVMN
jgi:signal transduction histidine kinase/putative methionine-R-sulfoxide reductase with GAF domain/ActR/RegA family two-component response regulator